MARKPTPEFQGTRRYEIRRTLGVGGMGVVYEAHDLERDVHVALKTLRRVDPAAVYRFKREFRAVVDANHPNLVRLFELVQEEDGRCFFTMEMVQGVDFLRWIGHDTWPGASTRTRSEGDRVSLSPPKAELGEGLSSSEPESGSDYERGEVVGSSPSASAGLSAGRGEATQDWDGSEITAPAAELRRDARPAPPAPRPDRPAKGSSRERFRPARLRLFRERKRARRSAVFALGKQTACLEHGGAPKRPRLSARARWGREVQLRSHLSSNYGHTCQLR